MLPEAEPVEAEETVTSTPLNHRKITAQSPIKL